MSDTRHTPEPWIYDTGDGLIYDGFKSDRSICYPIEVDHDPANARRIVACVNACAGMADPEKEIAALRAAAEKAMEALVKCSHLFNNIGQYGALAHESDWQKVNAVWGAVIVTLAALEEVLK